MITLQTGRSISLRPTLLALLLISLLPAVSIRAGWVTEKDGGQVVHFKLHDWILPDPERTDTATRADAAVIRAFTEKFLSLIHI